MSSELKSYHVSVSPRGDGNVQRRQAAGGDHGSAADVGSCSIKGGNEGLPAEWTSLAAGCLQGMIHLEIWWLLSDCCVWDILGYFGHFWMFICSFRPDPRYPEEFRATGVKEFSQKYAALLKQHTGEHALLLKQLAIKQSQQARWVKTC